MTLRIVTATLALGLGLCTFGAAQAQPHFQTNETTRKEAKADAKQEKKADKAQAKADKSREKALNSGKVKKAARDQDKANATAAGVSPQ